MKEYDMVPGLSLTLGELTNINHEIVKVVRAFYKPDKDNEWTSEDDIGTLMSHIVFKELLPGGFTTTLDCDDAVTLTISVLDHYILTTYDAYRRVRPAEITLGDGQRHAVLHYFISPNEWLVIDSRIIYIGQDKYEAKK